MIIYLLFAQFLNPYISANILATDDYTDDYFTTIYQIGIENDFYKKTFGGGIYVDYFYKKDYPFADPYFIKSGIPVVINAGGVGLQVKYFGIGYIEFGVKFGYYIGNLSYPILGDSGTVIKVVDKRNSLGMSVGTNIMHNFGRIRTGIKFWINFINFESIGERPPWHYTSSPEYVSLSSVGFGIILGPNKRNKE
ncbi:MAG: hypothetical protein ABIL69_01250 [candidate division WOR-3 bacterium]